VISRALLFAALGCLVLLAPVAAQQDAATLPAWRAAVEAHRPGVLDQPVRTVAGWTKSDLEKVLEAFRQTALPPGAPRDARAQRDAWLRRAILLHTDILVLLRQPGGYPLPPSGDRSVGLVADGVQVGVQRGTAQWAFTRRLVEDLQDANAARTWFRATSAFLQSWQDWPESSAHLAEGRKRFPDDAVLLLYEGTIHETYASPAIQTLELPKELMTPEPVSFATGSVFSLANLNRPAPAMSWVFQSADIERLEAERLLRQAIGSDRNLAEAHVRLGHVLGQRGRHADAIDALERGLQLSRSPIVRYWALVWLGQARRDAGRIAPAIEAFEQAAALFPRAQTPRLGLSQLLYDRGDRARALAEYTTALAATGPSTSLGAGDDDPRLVYEHTHVPAAGVLVVELRTAFGS
jgi:tetratricopeptide (TPR) repeat protein